MANSNFFAIVLVCSSDMLQVLRTLSFILSCEQLKRATTTAVVATPFYNAFAITNSGHGVREEAKES